MTTNATLPANPPVSAARYSEAVHFLSDKPMRALFLGLAEINAERHGGRPKEGDTIRDLLEKSIGQLAKRDREKYDEALRRGMAELSRRAEAADARRAKLAARAK